MTPVKNVRKRFVTKPGRKPVSRYLYVEARALGNDHDFISFRDVMVTGVLTEDQAYKKGAELLDAQDAAETDVEVLAYLNDSYALNDYVVKL